MADFEGKITGSFADDDDLIRTGRALIELDGFNMLRVPVPSDYWEFLDSAAGQVEAVSLDAERAVEAAGDATEQAGKAKQEADRAADSERAAIQAQVRSENAADRAETRVDEAINNGAELIRDEVKQDADRAVAAKNGAQSAQSAAEGAASTATSAAGDASQYKDAAKQSETNALQSENDAAGFAELAEQYKTAAGVHESNAARSETNAAQSESNAAASEQAAATSASNAATSEANAQDSATAAAGSASEAAAHADRAEQAADPTGLRDEITQQLADLVDGAPEDLDTIREVAEYAQENRDITDQLNAAIGAKADATDASGRTVARYDPGSSQWLRVGDNPAWSGEYSNSAALNLRSADSRYASKTHTHTVSQVDGLDDALAGKASTQALADGLAGKADAAVVNARPALFSGTGTPPSSIPNARVGDWWLDTSTMELHKITGV